LFDAICEVDEYYVTRADLDATRRNIDAIAAHVGAGVRLVELGSGNSVKTRLLLDALDDVRAYVPVDISTHALEQSAQALRTTYPQLEVMPLRTDYTRPLELPEPTRPATRTVVYYPGSTIGNFHRPDAAAFLKRIGKLVGPSGGALIGVDLKKDKDVLERAYDDAAGVTADFNLNLLVRINRELGADFDLEQFAHLARYDEQLGRIEMHLVSQRAQTAHIAEKAITFDAGETIRTEESYKYSVDDFARTAGEGGLKVTTVWYDADMLFSLQWLSSA